MTREELLQKKRHVLLKSDGSENPKAAIIDPFTKLSGDYIELGKFWSDEVKGWYLVDDLASSVVHVVKEFDGDRDYYDYPPLKFKDAFCDFLVFLGLSTKKNKKNQSNNQLLKSKGW